MRVRELRRERGLTIRQLAEMSGVSYATIVHLENGDTTPRPSTLEKLASALDVPLREITRSPEDTITFTVRADDPRAGQILGLITREDVSKK
jgi:transcriptional regulator with XRE-family HTH domain